MELLTHKEEIAKIIGETTEKIIVMADENNIDRDLAMKYFSGLFAAMVSISTFTDYRIK